MTARLVQEAQNAFIEARQAAETTAIGESITILERYSASLNEGINKRLLELQRAQARSAPVVRRRPRVVARPSENAVIPNAPDQSSFNLSISEDSDLGRLKANLAKRRQDLARLEEGRQRQLAEAQAKLQQLKTVYTDSHPSVLSAQQNLAALTNEPPQMATLAAEIEELQADYDKQLDVALDLQIQDELERRSDSVQARSPVIVEEPLDPEPLPDPRPASPLGEVASLSLRSELRQLESVLDRTDAARIELAVSQAAFKYRYTVIRPSQVPKDPASPNFKKVLAAGIFASVILALAVVVAKDLLSGRILEPWQIERQLGLPILGTLRVA
jgi:hypothetical protein